MLQTEVQTDGSTYPNHIEASIIINGNIQLQHCKVGAEYLWGYKMIKAGIELFSEGVGGGVCFLPKRYDLNPPKIFFCKYNK